MSIATQTGDDGTTGLMFGRRVPKNDLRVEACGAVDELNASLGVARAALNDRYITGPIFEIQQELVILMGELGVLEEDRMRYAEKGYRSVTSAMVEKLTGLVDELELRHPTNLKHWATPGATPGSAALDVARTTCRRAERRVVDLSNTGTPLSPEIIRYLNRLSDLCWLYARYAAGETTVGPAVTTDMAS